MAQARREGPGGSAGAAQPRSAAPDALRLLAATRRRAPPARRATGRADLRRGEDRRRSGLPALFWATASGPEGASRFEPLGDVWGRDAHRRRRRGAARRRPRDLLGTVRPADPPRLAGAHQHHTSAMSGPTVFQTENWRPDPRHVRVHRRRLNAAIGWGLVVSSARGQATLQWLPFDGGPRGLPASIARRDHPTVCMARPAGEGDAAPPVFTDDDRVERIFLGTREVETASVPLPVRSATLRAARGRCTAPATVSPRTSDTRPRRASISTRTLAPLRI